jgi:3-oxoacyl-[acyl-carrier-protein] synthase-1/3-oxoacyl-[acyl-carrier-protein] synthase II
MTTLAAPVSITGLGCLSAAGSTVAENMASLEQGRRNSVLPTFLQVEKQFPVFQSPMKDGDPSRLPDPSYYDLCARTARLAAQATLEALGDAGLHPMELSGLKVGICLGTSVGTGLKFTNYYTAMREGRDAPLDPIFRYLVSNPAPALARMLQTRGPVQTVTNACTSGADAIGYGAQWIRSGLCDVVICGGTDALDRLVYLGFGSLKLISPEPCLPFDKKRVGLSLGEGAGILVLESPARTRGRRVRGKILGYGTATDAFHLTAPHPEARGLILALNQAFAQAGSGKNKLAFINAHGTATPTNDVAEGWFFRKMLPQIPVIATKGGTGHTLGAAGAVEAVFTLMHLNQGQLPASIGFSDADPAIGMAPVTEITPVAGDIAMSQSLAFGGNNSVLLLGKGEA